MIRKIILKNIEFKKGETVINHEPNKMWDDDIISTSSELHFNIEGDKQNYRYFVDADNVDEAIKEVIPKICYNELLIEDLKFTDIGLSDVKYETYDDGDGYITSICEFDELLNAEIYLVDKKIVLEQLHNKAVDLFEVVI